VTTEAGPTILSSLNHEPDTAWKPLTGPPFNTTGPTRERAYVTALSRGEQTIGRIPHDLAVWYWFLSEDLDYLQKDTFCPGHSKMNVVEMVNRVVKQVIRAYQIPSGDGSIEAYRSAAKFVLSLLHGKTYAGTPLIAKAIEKADILAQLPGGKARSNTKSLGTMTTLPDQLSRCKPSLSVTRYAEGPRVIGQEICPVASNQYFGGSIALYHIIAQCLVLPVRGGLQALTGREAEFRESGGSHSRDWV
jgi:hypothetical protein